MSARVQSSEGLSRAGGFISKAADLYTWQDIAGCQSEVLSFTTRTSPWLLEYLIL